MGRLNKQRRPRKNGTAKDRDRRRARATQAVYTHEPPPSDQIRFTLITAATSPTRRDECLNLLVSGGFPARQVDAVADAVVGEVLGRLWPAGWLPVDLYQVVRRRIDELAADFVGDAIAGQIRRYPAATLHDRWLAQLAELDLTVWWAADRPHLSQWAQRRHELGRREVLGLAVEVLALLAKLLPLEQLVPPPGTARTAMHQAGSGSNEKMLAKVRALLAKAESTEFDEEAEALSAKAQELMSRYSLHHALRTHQGISRPTPTARRIWLDAPYLSAKALLVDAVARANRCRAVFAPNWGFVTVLGDDVDLGFVELLTTSLLVQATNAMLASGRHVNRVGTSRTRSFRQSFLVSYAGRIGERLRGVAEAEVAAAERTTSLLPVLAAREQEVRQLLNSMFPHMKSHGVSVSNAAGWGAGRAAADLAVLDVRNVIEPAAETA